MSTLNRWCALAHAISVHASCCMFVQEHGDEEEDQDIEEYVLLLR